MQEVDLDVIDRIKQIVLEKDVLAAMEKLLAPAELNRVSQAIDKMQAKEAFVAAIGSQGTGKSSLLNSLLFPRRILPIGEGVTTNIVCYIQDAKDAEEHCDVVLDSGTVEKLPLDRAALEAFLDEAQNPGNHKGVVRISCFTRSDLLGKNTIFVDTPGLGSTVETHDKKTMDFVRDLSLGVFLLRTTPTILDSEVKFLTMIWKSCPEFVFVQNVWGESTERVGESLRDNGAILTRLAQQQGDMRPICLVPVNIHEGLEGVANDIPDKVRESGLAHLRSLVKTRVSRGGQRLEILAQGRQIVPVLRLAIQEGHTRIAAASVRGELKLEQLRARIEGAETSRKEIEKRHRERERKFRRDCEEDLRNWRKEIENEIDSVYKQFSHEVRSHGGEAGIDTAYLDRLQQVASRSCDAFKNGLARNCEDFIEESAIDIDLLLESLKVTLKDDDGTVVDVSGTHVAEAIGTVTTSASGVTLTALTAISATAFGTTIAAGATVTTALAAGLAAVPVIGWVIAAGALAAGYLLKVAAKERRVNALVLEFDRIANRLKADAVETIKEEAHRIRDLVSEGVAGHMRAAAEQQEKQAESLRTILSSTDRERTAEQADLRQKIDLLLSTMTEIEQLVQLDGAEAA